MSISTMIIVIAIMVIMSAYFSGTETAFTSFNKSKMKTYAEKGNKRAKLALKLESKYDKLLSTILIGNNIVNIAASSIGTLLFIEILSGKATIDTSSVTSMASTLSTIVLTIVVLICGEITPKNAAKEIPEKFAMFSAPFINILMIILTPINFCFSFIKKFIKFILSKLVKGEAEENLAQEELLMLVDEVESDGSIDNDEGSLLRNAIEFSDRLAEDILTHRIDLEAVPTTATKEEIATKFAETKFSRILVYEESIDNIIGFIHQKDLYTAQGLTGLKVSELVSPTVFVQKTEKSNDILKKLQREKTHIAVVLDEYGGTLGIVTMEDLLEELVGEIWDEHDEVLEPICKVSDDTYTVDCTVDFSEFCEFFNITTEDSEAVSTGGFIMELFDKVPEENESCEYNGLIITVRETDFQRISKVEIKVSEPLPAEEAEEAKEKEEANA